MSIAMRRENIYIYVQTEDEKNELEDILHRGVLVGQIKTGGMAQAILDAPKWSIIPYFLVIDIRGVDEPELALQTLSESVSGGNTTLILLGEKDNIETYRYYTDLGAADYLPAPTNADSLFTSIARIASEKEPHELNEARSIMFVGIRGGVGTSTLAAACAEIIVDKHKRRCIIIDFDTTHGAQSMIFNKSPTPGFIEMLKNPQRIDSVFLDRSIEEAKKGLFILSCNDQNENELIEKEPPMEIIRQSQEGIDMVVCDVPYHPRIDIASISCAGTLFLCTTPTLLGLRDLTEIITYLNDNKYAGKIIVTLTKCGEKTGFEVSREHFEKMTQATVIEIAYDPKTPATAMKTQQPIHEIKGKLATSLFNIEQELPTYVEKPKDWKDKLKDMLNL